MAGFDTSSFDTKYNDPVNPLTQAKDIYAVKQAQADLQNKLTQNQRQTVGLSADQAALGLTHFNNLQTILAPLSVKDDLSQKDMQGALSDAVGRGMITPEDALKEQMSWGEDNPAANRIITNTHLVRAQSAADQMKTIIGTNHEVRNGGNITQGVLNSPLMGGQYEPTSSQAVTLTPSEKVSENQYLGDNNEKEAHSVGERYTPTGERNMASVSTPSQQPITPVEGDVNAPSQAATAAANVPAIPAVVKNSNRTALSPGVTEAAASMGHIAGQNLADDITALNHSPDTLYSMEAAGKALQNAPTGKGSEWRNAVKSYAIAFAPKVFKDTDWEHDVHAYDDAMKYLSQQTQRMGSQYGPKTNDNLALAMSGSPNTKISNMSAQELQGVMTGLQRLNYARTAVFQYDNPNGTPQEYQAFGQPFNKGIDPRGMMVDLMPKAQLAKTLKELGPSVMPDGTSNPKRQKFDNAYNIAVQYGFMNHVAGQ